MTDLRDEHGCWLGVLDMELPTDDRLHWLVPVRQEPFVFWDVAQSVTMATFDKVELTRQTWFDGRHYERVFVVRNIDVPKLPKASHVILRGATCETKYGEMLRHAETMRRFMWILALHLMPTDGVKH